MSDTPHLRDTLSGQAGLLTELVAQAIQPTLDNLSISYGAFELLTAVHASEGDANQAEIARRLGITAPSLTEAVRAAIQAGLVEQVPVPTDARAKNLRITVKGRVALDRIIEQVNETERIMVEGIEDRNLRSALVVLKTASRNLARKISVR